MRKQHFYMIGITALLAGAIMIVRTPSPGSGEPCQETMDGDCCLEKPETDRDKNVIWETVNSQFFSASGLN